MIGPRVERVWLHVRFEAWNVWRGLGACELASFDLASSAASLAFTMDATSMSERTLGIRRSRLVADPVITMLKASRKRIEMLLVPAHG